MLNIRQTVSCVVIDDDPDAIDLLVLMLQEIDRVNILDSVSDSSKAIQSILRYKPDIVFLDIKMDGLDGIDILKKIKKLNVSVHIVIVSSYEKYALDAIKNYAFNFLVKPYTFSELEGIIKTFRKEQLKNTRNNTGNPSVCPKVIIPTSKGVLFYNCDEVVYLEAERNYTFIYLNDKSKILSSINMGKLQQNLPEGFFLKIHRSYIVNKQYLFRVEKANKKCYLKTNNEEICLKISKNFMFSQA